MVCTVAPTPRTGRLGFVGNLDGGFARYSRVRNWTLDSVANPELRVYSGTRFGTDRIPGFVESTGNFQGFGGVPPLFVGDEFEFIGYTAPTSGIPCTDGCAFSLPAIVTSLNITWNWTAENRGVNWTIGFGSIGPVSEDAAFDDNCDDEVFCDDNPCDLELRMFDCDNVEIEWCNFASASLNFVSNVASYSNSSTNCQILKAIGNLDWTMEIVDQNTCVIPITQDTYWFEIDASTTAMWILKWAMSLGWNNLRVDTESNEVISKSNNFGMKAVNCCIAGNPLRGSIIDPLGTTVWPYATAS